MSWLQVVELAIDHAVARDEARPPGELLDIATEELSHPAPVFHGDTLYCESEVLDVRPSSSKPDRGVVKVAGDDAGKFLNVLLTVDDATVTPPHARFTALLSACSTRARRSVDAPTSHAPHVRVSSSGWTLPRSFRLLATLRRTSDAESSLNSSSNWSTFSG